MARIRSSWLGEARRLIAAALAQLPKDATIKDKRAACRAAYPWGERKCHPYRQWCKAQREALGTKKAGPPADYKVTPQGVICRICPRGGLRGGCICCMAARLKLEAMPVALREEWAALEKQAMTDKDAEGILADWIEEHWGET